MYIHGWLPVPTTIVNTAIHLRKNIKLCLPNLYVKYVLNNAINLRGIYSFVPSYHII